jgi:hypothetical protein
LNSAIEQKGYKGKDINLMIEALLEEEVAA